MYDLKKRRCTHCGSDRSVWLVWRVSIVELRECAYTVLADVFEESLDEIFSPAVECRAHHAEAQVDVWCEKVRECTALMVSEVTVDL